MVKNKQQYTRKESLTKLRSSVESNGSTILYKAGKVCLQNTRLPATSFSIRFPAFHQSSNVLFKFFYAWNLRILSKALQRD